MAEIETFMGLSATDIEKIMGVSTDDIETVMGVELTSYTYTWAGSRSVISGGDVSSAGLSNVIQYKTLASDANTSDFGDLLSNRAYSFSGSNVTRGIIAGGIGYSGGSNVYGISDTDYITVGSTGNGTDFGNLDRGSGWWNNGSSNGTLMFSCGGIYKDSGNYYRADRMEYFTIASTGDGTDAGNLSMGVDQGAQANGDSRYLVWLGVNPSTGAVMDTVEYGTFHTSNDTSDFGNLSTSCAYGSMCADNTRVVTMTRQPRTDVMDYFTVASTGDATDFGNLTDVRSEGGAVSDGTRGEINGGVSDSAKVNIIEKITIQSAGDSSDVGDLTTAGSTSGVAASPAALSGT